MRSPIRSGVTLLAWVLAAWLLLSAGFRKDTYRERVREALPKKGQVLLLDSVAASFGVDLVRESGREKLWLLVVTSNCPGCLNLGPEIPAITRAADCAGALLVGLVVSGRDGADSIRAVLQDSGLTRLGKSGPEGLSLLKTFAVPTILELDGSGKVSSVANPEFGNWPPRAACGRG